MNEVPNRPYDYQARPRHMSPIFLSALAVMLVAFAGTLMIALLWNILDVFNGGELQDRNRLLPFVWYLFVVLTFVKLLGWGIVQFLAFRAQLSKSTTPSYDSSAWPGVSILVPAYQEAENIEATLGSLVELEYPHYEIIVVDDGSSDETFEKAHKFSGKSGTVSVLRKDNGGKWSALNLAFEHAKYELILCVDGDSRLSRNALQLLVPHMRDPRIAAVCGQVTVRNRVNLITRLQALEYLIANGGLRTAQSHLGSVLIVPGPIGLYRRSNLEQIAKLAGKIAEHVKSGHVAGPLSGETFAEDFQLSLTTLALNGRIVYEPRAISYTRAPENMLSLMNQRYRWMRGGMQVITVYYTKLRARCNAADHDKLDAILTWSILGNIYVMPMINITALIALLFMIAIGDSLAANAFAWFLATWLLNVMTATFYILSQGDEFPLLAPVMAVDLYGLLINSVWFAAVADHLRKSKMRW